jgi:hypothetical protein
VRRHFDRDFERFAEMPNTLNFTGLLAQRRSALSVA